MELFAPHAQVTLTMLVLTGTALAYAPAGSLRAAQPKSRDDYEAWSPE